MWLSLATFTVSFLALSSAVAQQWKPQLVANDESSDRNIRNYRFDPRHTAGGHFQITDANWRHYAPLVDIDLNKMAERHVGARATAGPGGRQDVGYGKLHAVGSLQRAPTSRPRNTSGGSPPAGLRCQVGRK
jgi:hypothetical protein